MDVVKYYLDVAKAVAQSSDCDKCKSGCIAVANGSIVGSAASKCLNKGCSCKSMVTCGSMMHHFVYLQANTPDISGCDIYVWYGKHDHDPRIDCVAKELSDIHGVKSYSDNVNDVREPRQRPSRECKSKQQGDSPDKNKKDLVNWAKRSKHKTHVSRKSGESDKNKSAARKQPTGTNVYGVKTYGFAKCKRCGKEFEMTSPNQRYCNQTKVGVCTICGKPFSYRCGYGSYKGTVKKLCGSPECKSKQAKMHVEDLHDMQRRKRIEAGQSK